MKDEYKDNKKSQYNCILELLSKDIEEIIDDLIEKKEENKIISQLKNISIIIKNLKEDLSNAIITGDPNEHFSYEIVPKLEYKQDWSAYISSSLINKRDEHENIYNNILKSAALIGSDGTVWSEYDNHIKKEEILEINSYFNQNKKNIKCLQLNDKGYIVTDYKPNQYIDFVDNSDEGGTISKTRLAYVVGFYNKKRKYRFNGLQLPQNQDLCHKTVEDCAQSLRDAAY